MAELAAKMTPTLMLTATIERFNAAAEQGVDAEFQRGSTDCQRANGDATHNAKSVYGALRTGSRTTRSGSTQGILAQQQVLRTDAAARVLDQRGRPIAGLYACGNDVRIRSWEEPTRARHHDRPVA